MKKKILITGGTGYVGAEIQNLLKDPGYEVAVLSRKKPESGKTSFYWNYKTGELDEEALKFADIIIHLAGENISQKRWTQSQKKEIYDSRVLSTQFLLKKIKETGFKPEKIISASAIGYYGTETSGFIYKEEHPPGNDFLAVVVKDWEKEVLEFEKAGIPVLIYRIGVVFSTDGGALKEMIKSLRLKLAFPVGSGEQYLAWISKYDLARTFLFGIENKELTGIYNAVSPSPVKQKELMEILATQYQSFYVPIPVPGFLIRWLKGEMSSIILKGSRISSEKLLQKGFHFKQPLLQDLFR